MRACDFLGGGTVSLSVSSSESSLASMSSAAAAAALSSSCCGRLLGACRCAVCLLLLRLVLRLHGDLSSEAQYSRFQLRDVGRDSRGRVLPTEAQYSRFQLCDFGSDSRVGFALGYGLDALVDHPHLF